MRKASIVLVAFSSVILTANAYAQPCPVAIPTPASEFHVSCKAAQNVEQGRCASPLPPSVCQTVNDDSNAMGNLSPEAYTWLTSNGYCAISAAPGYILSICPVGCFEENTSILTVGEDGSDEWLAAKDITPKHQIFSLQSDALLSSPQFTGRSIERITYGPEEPELYVFSMSNDRKLRVTSHHPMILTEGRVIEAKDVVESDSFIGLDGSSVEIESISREPTDADVYNFAVAANTMQEHVIVAEDVLVGDLVWQVTIGGEEKSIDLRR